MGAVRILADGVGCWSSVAIGSVAVRQSGNHRCCIGSLAVGALAVGGVAIGEFAVGGEPFREVAVVGVVFVPGAVGVPYVVAILF